MTKADAVQYCAAERSSAYTPTARGTVQSEMTIEERLKLGKLIPPLLQAAFDGRISPAVAKALTKQPSSAQLRLAAVLEEQGTLRLKDVEAERHVAAAQAVALLPDELFQTPAIAGAGRDDLLARLRKAPLAAGHNFPNNLLSTATAKERKAFIGAVIQWWQDEIYPILNDNQN